MQIRFLKLTDSSYPEVSFGTFHSVFYQIIRNSLSDKNSKLEIADIKFQTEMIRDILSSLKARGQMGKEEYEDYIPRIPDILSEISRIKNLGLSPAESSEGLGLMHIFPVIYDSYNRSLREFGKTDFDDMMKRCYELLSENRSILDFYRKKYRFILIDEYQDINPIQSGIIDLLLGEDGNLFAVGDDDQSIYGFRGSEPGIMLDFMERYKNYEPKLINLDVNYRSGSEILKTAQMVIHENKTRYGKELSAFGPNGPGKVAARRYDTRKKQGEAIALFLEKHRENLSDIAILFRTNSEARNMLPFLQEKGIPTNLDGYIRSIYQDKAVDTVLSYLKFAYEGHKRVDFLRIINVPARYISREAASADTVNEKDLLRYYKGNRERQKSIKDFFKSIEMIAHMRPALSVRYLRKTAGIDREFKKSLENLDILEEKAREFENTARFLQYTTEQKESEELNKKSSPKALSGNRVNLLTMHGSKGLEFGIVWLPDLNEGIIPSRSAVSDAEKEEERRMLYVAMTRAKQALIMSYIKGTKESPMLPSRFLRPIKQLWDANYKDG
jgi:DNA helicase-2/ATP-dependent DNA helicase PcrA